MKRKKTNIKIKRSKVNLYNKQRRSRSRKVLSVVLTVVIVIGLGILGYGLGKPIMEYLTDRENEPESSAAWTPPVSESSEAPEEPSSEETSPDSSEAEEPPAAVGSMYILPDDAVLSSASLNSALAAAKASGNKIAAVTMRGDDGIFLYKSEIKGIKDSETLIKGTLTASQVREAIVKAGLVPAARISTLKDKSCGKTMGAAYELAGGDGYWLDQRPEKGGKMWLSPFKNQTLQFIGSITAELSAAGFKHIIAVNTMFPVFFNVDYKTYLADLPIGDADKRLEALWNVADSAKAGAERNGAMFWLELGGEDAVKEQKLRLSTDAELCANADKLKEIKLIVNYTPGASTADAYKDAKEFSGKIAGVLDGADYYVAIKGGFSGSALSDVRKAFSEAGIDTFK